MPADHFQSEQELKSIVLNVVCETIQTAFDPFGDSQFGNLPLSFTVSDEHIFTASKRQHLMGKDLIARSTRNVKPKPLSLQEINRRIGRYATLTNRNQRPIRWKRVERDVRLHGVGRRSRLNRQVYFQSINLNFQLS